LFETSGSRRLDSSFKFKFEGIVENGESGGGRSEQAHIAIGTGSDRHEVAVSATMLNYEL
jgi:hypothetical protein